MKNKILWLDDLRDPVRHGFPNAYWAKNYDEAISAMSNYQFAGASLDHDLGACADCERKGTHIGDMLTPRQHFMDTARMPSQDMMLFAGWKNIITGQNLVFGCIAQIQLVAEEWNK